MKIEILIFLLLNYILPTKSNITIITPKSLKSKFSKEIPYRLGNFGRYPYGSSFQGKVYYNPDKIQNQACDYSKLTPYTGEDQQPLIYLVESGNCTYAKKAKNIGLIGGKMMLLISWEANLELDFSIYDDGNGPSINIPSVFINSIDGGILKDFILNKGQKNDYPVINMKFLFVEKENSKVDFYLSSSDFHSMKLLYSLESYFLRLGNLTTFTPIYKYYKCDFCSIETQETIDADCISNGLFCGIKEESLHIYSGKVLLNENLRQKCIFNEHKNENLTHYFKYVNHFSDLCADSGSPDFNDKCSNSVLKNLSVNIDQINSCMKKALNDPNNSIINEDYNKFKNNKVYNFPSLLINGEIYRGSNNVKYIIDAICSSLKDKSVCKKFQDEKNNKKSSNIALIVVIFAVIIIVLNFVLIFFYRRMVNQNLDTSIKNKIDEYAAFSMNQYNVFKEEQKNARKIKKSQLEEVLTD